MSDASQYTEIIELKQDIPNHESQDPPQIGFINDNRDQNEKENDGVINKPAEETIESEIIISKKESIPVKRFPQSNENLQRETQIFPVLTLADINQPVPNPTVVPADVTQSNNVTTFTTIQLGEVPKQLFCPSCKANILTKIKYEKGILAWLVCVGICVFGGGCGCCLIPFCIDSLKDVDHYCPNCHTFLGRYKRI